MTTNRPSIYQPNTLSTSRSINNPSSPLASSNRLLSNSSGQHSYTKAVSSSSRPKVVRSEVEQFTLSGYQIKSQTSGSNGKVISLAPTVQSGNAVGKFAGTSGTYSVRLGYWDTQNGAAQATVTLAGRTAQLSFNRTSGGQQTQKTLFSNLPLKTGDRIEIRGKANQQDRAKVDWIEFIPTASVTPTPSPTPAPSTISPPLPTPSSSAITNNFSSGWKTRWKVQTQGDWGDNNMQVMSNPGSKYGSVLRIHYPSKSASPTVSRKEGTPQGGAQFYATLGMTPKTTMHLSYDVKFSSNFDFVKGGKLPGLYGGKGNNGGNIPEGTDGFSTRFMWRRQGQGEVYAYLPSSQDHGTSLGRGAWSFKPGVWHHIEQEVSLNQPGKANGQVKVWLDGKSVFTNNQLTFRTADSLKINGLFFSSFFGGDDSSWSTPKDVYADFANFSLR